MEPKNADHILWCDGCKDLIMPKEKYYAAGGKIFCVICWGNP